MKQRLTNILWIGIPLAFVAGLFIFGSKDTATANTEEATTTESSNQIENAETSSTETESPEADETAVPGGSDETETAEAESQAIETSESGAASTEDGHTEETSSNSSNPELKNSEVNDETQANSTSSEHKFELAKQYYGDCTNADDSRFEQIRPHLKAFTDAEVMAKTMSDPGKFMELMAVVNDPHTIHTMTKCATEPVMWDTWLSGMTDFNKMARAMTMMMNPQVIMSWMAAPMNPKMYAPMMQMMNPEYYMKWMTAMTNPVFYEPIYSLANPQWYAPRINWMMNMGNSMSEQQSTLATKGQTSTSNK